MAKSVLTCYFCVQSITEYSVVYISQIAGLTLSVRYSVVCISAKLLGAYVQCAVYCCAHISRVGQNHIYAVYCK